MVLAGPIIRQGDNLQLFITSAIDVRVFSAVQIRYDDGTPDILTTPQIASGSARTTVLSESTTKAIKNGTIVNAAIFQITGGVARGQLYATLALSWYSLPICKGYVYDGHAVSMGEFIEASSGRGFLRSIDLGNPAAGAEYTTQTVPTNAVWRVLSFEGTLVADASGANRAPSVQYQDTGNNIVSSASSRDATIASETTVWSAFIGAQGTQDVTVSLAGHFALPDTRISGGYDVVFLTHGILAGDNWGDGQLLVEEWIEVP